jgi:hypothetical protein
VLSGFFAGVSLAAAILTANSDIARPVDLRAVSRRYMPP